MIYLLVREAMKTQDYEVDPRQISTSSNRRDRQTELALHCCWMELTSELQNMDVSLKLLINVALK